jgi:hypothetical protein
MTVDDLKTYLETNLNACIAARSTVDVPLVAIAIDQIYTRNYRLPAKDCEIFLDPQPETVEDFTMDASLVRLPVEILVFTKGDMEALMRAKALGYRRAILDCIGAHPDYMRHESRDTFDGVEGKDDTKVTKLVAEFEYEEAI